MTRHISPGQKLRSETLRPGPEQSWPPLQGRSWWARATHRTEGPIPPSWACQKSGLMVSTRRKQEGKYGRHCLMDGQDPTFRIFCTENKDHVRPRSLLPTTSSRGTGPILPPVRNPPGGKAALLSGGKLGWSVGTSAAERRNR